MANDVKRLPARVVTDYSLDTIRKHTFEVALLILHRWPVYFPWGEGATGDHHAGKALDFPTYEFGEGVQKPGPLRVAMGQEIANYLWANRKTLGVRYVIYRRHIISINSNSYGPAGRWNPMEDRGNATKNHMDHVHVSFLENPPAYTYKPPAPKPSEDDMPTAEEIAREVWEHQPPYAKVTMGEYQVGTGIKLDAEKGRDEVEAVREAAEAVTIATLHTKQNELIEAISQIRTIVDELNAREKAQ